MSRMDFPKIPKCPTPLQAYDFIAQIALIFAVVPEANLTQPRHGQVPLGKVSRAG